MTTKNLKGVEALRKSIADSVADVRNRADQVSSSVTAVQTRSEQEQKDAAIAARLLLQATNDELEVLDEEAGQLAYILGGAPVVPSAPVVEDTPAQPTPAPAPVAEPECAPAPEAPEPPMRASLLDPRFWGWLAWLLFAIGAVIGLIIADQWSADAWVRTQVSDNTLGGWLVTNLFAVFWWAGWPLLIGGLFGSLGARWERRQ